MSGQNTAAFLGVGPSTRDRQRRGLAEVRLGPRHQVVVRQALLLFCNRQVSSRSQLARGYQR